MSTALPPRVLFNGEFDMRMELIARGKCIRSYDGMCDFEDLAILKPYWDLEWTHGADTIVNIYGDDGKLLKSCTFDAVMEDWRPWMGDDERELGKKSGRPARSKPVFDPDDLSPCWIFTGLLLAALMVVFMWFFGDFDRKVIAGGFIKRPDGAVERINIYNYQMHRNGAVYLETDKGCFETGVNNVWLER